MMNTLIIGGTSGLGLEIARSEVASGNNAIITGRHNPNVRFAEYKEFELSMDDLPNRIGQFVMGLPPIQSLIYAAGFYQEGHITDLSDEGVDDMINVGARGLIFFVKKLLEKQNCLDELVTITSTSQWTPREYEPVYNFVKAGAAHYSNGQALDPRVRRTLVAGTSGMDTEFWDDTNKDTSTMMRPEWVAKNIMELRKKNTNYMFAKILGSVAGESPNITTEELNTQAVHTDWIPEPKTLPWRLLSAINQEPNLNSRELTKRLSHNQETQISRAGAKLLKGGYVTKRKIGRSVFWETTDLGADYLASNKIIYRR